MKRKKQLDIALLLGFLLLFCCGISFLQAKSARDTDFTSSDQELLNQILPSAAAQDVKNIANLFSKISLGQQKRLISRIILDEESPLSTQSKIELILALALANTDKDQQLNILYLLKEIPQLEKQAPVLYIAAQKYPLAIPVLNTWLKHDASKKQQWVYEAVYYAIIKNTPEVFEVLLKKLDTLPARDATQLLWEVVMSNRNPAFVPGLVQKEADVDNVRDGKTLLIAAVERNEKSLVQALLKQGADINKIADPVAGSALQVAIRKGYADLDVLLRDAGAKP